MKRTSILSAAVMLIAVILLGGTGFGAAKSASKSTKTPPLPTITITSPTSSKTMTASSSRLYLSGTATAAKGLKIVGVKYLGSGDTVIPCAIETKNGRISWFCGSPYGEARIFLNRGKNSITVMARDSKGRTAKATLVIVYDASSPQVSITDPSSIGSYTQNTRSLSIGGTAEAADDAFIDSVTWSSNRGGSGYCSGSVSWRASGIVLQPGRNVITITARDNQGEEGSDSIVFTYDPDGPAVNITDPTSSSSYEVSSNSISIGGSAEAADGVDIRDIGWSNSRGGSGYCSGAASWSANRISLKPGYNMITVTVRDSEGKDATDSITVRYRPPDTKVEITSPPYGSSYDTNSSSLNIEGRMTVADGVSVSSISWSNDRGGGGSGSSSGYDGWYLGTVSLKTGRNVITVIFTDSEGRSTTSSITVMYRIPGPSIRISSPNWYSSRNSKSSPLEIFGYAEVADAAGFDDIRWSNNRGGSGSCSGTTAWSARGISLKPGDNTITVTVRDSEKQEASASVSIKYEVLPPKISISTSGGKTSSNSVSISGSALPDDDVSIDSVKWSNNRRGSGSCSGTTSWSASEISLEPGDNTITVTVRDCEQQETSESVTFTYVIPPPSVSISSSGGRTSSNSVTISGSASVGEGARFYSVDWSNNRGGSGSCTGTTSWSTSFISLEPGDNTITVTVRDSERQEASASITFIYNPE